MSKESYLSNREWKIGSLPFKHAVIENVFVPEVHQRLCAAFDDKLARAQPRAKAGGRYDAIIATMTEEDRAAFSPVLDRDFLETLANALDLEVTFEVDSAIHHHPPNSRTGWIHNDFNPGWFGRAAGSDDIVLADNTVCNYRQGKPFTAPAKPVQRMRHLTMLYYLNNADWTAADGGETGLYASFEQSVQSPDVVVPPRENSMMLFECSPHSFHSFLSSKRTRNSVILWLHRTMPSAKAQWPHHDPVYW